MEPIQFKEANHIFKKPDHMTDEQCGSLHAFVTVELGYPDIVSCWRPSWRERLSILLFGRVWLHVAGRSMPPVGMTAARNIFRKAEPADDHEK